MAVPKGCISKKNVISISTDNNKKVTTFVPIWWETDDDRFAGVRDRDNLVQSAVISPLRFKAKLCRRTCDAAGINQPLVRSDRTYLGSMLKTSVMR